MSDAGWDEYRKLFPELKPTHWLNHAGVSPTSTAVARAIQDHADDAARHGASHVVDWYGSLKGIKKKASRLLGCRPPDLAVTPNTTHGVNIVANGIRWAPGDEVVLCSKEYPANVYPWWAQRKKGVKLVWVEPDGEGRFPVDSYEKKINERTRVLTVSHVQFATGYRHDLERLGKICKDASILFFVDAIQSFSVFPIDIDGWNVDALTTGSHKWLLGPTGIALFHVSARLREELDTTYVGADCMVDSLNYLDYKFEPHPDGRRFENAMLNFYGVAGLNAALSVVERFGRDRICSEIRSTTDWLIEQLGTIGYRNHAPRTDAEWSGILSLTHSDVDPPTLYSRLKERGVVTSIRDERLRVSPHAYHSGEDRENIVKAFEEVAR